VLSSSSRKTLLSQNRWAIQQIILWFFFHTWFDSGY
jgi:hypothetical protein